MNVVVNSQTLASELRLLNKVVPSKPAIQILGHVLLEADDEGLKLYATDLEIGLATTCKAETRMRGRTALPANRFLQIVEQFRDDDVELTGDGKTVVVRCGSYATKLQAGDATDFPQPPKPGDGIEATLDAASLRQLIAKTRGSVSQSGQARTLQGACLTLAGPVGAMAATDGKRLSIATVARSGPDARTIIPTKALDLLAAQQDSGEVAISISSNGLLFHINGRTINSRTVDGEYPKYEMIVPRENNLRVGVDRMTLLAALRRVVLTAEDTKAIRFNLRARGLELWSSSAGIGSASEEVPVDYDGEPLKIWMSGEYVLDFLEAAVGREVTISLKDGNTAALLADGKSHLGVIMLMKQS